MVVPVMARAIRAGWCRLTDDFYDDPRLIAVSADAELLFVRGIAYSKRHGLDGMVPAASLQRLDHKFVGDAMKARDELLSTELWVATKQGDHHGVPRSKWEHYQETRAEEIQRRLDGAERARKSREKRAAQSNGDHPRQEDTA